MVALGLYDVPRLRRSSTTAGIKAAKFNFAAAGGSLLYCRSSFSEPTWWKIFDKILSRRQMRVLYFIEKSIYGELYYLFFRLGKKAKISPIWAYGFAFTFMTINFQFTTIIYILDYFSIVKEKSMICTILNYKSSVSFIIMEILAFFLIFHLGSKKTIFRLSKLYYIKFKYQYNRIGLKVLAFFILTGVLMISIFAIFR
jgi:hypothetical protein